MLKGETQSITPDIAMDELYTYFERIASKQVIGGIVEIWNMVLMILCKVSSRGALLDVCIEQSEVDLIYQTVEMW